VILPDDVIAAETPCLQPGWSEAHDRWLYGRCDGSAKDKASSYGVIDIRGFRVHGVRQGQVENPLPKRRPTWRSGRYILTPPDHAES
jgi:UTP-glucose-1-phosphate uridylyltransferase